MTDNEKLDLLLEKITGLESDMSNLKSDMSNLKSDMSNLKSDMSNIESDMGSLKSDMGSLKSDMEEIKQRVTKIDLTIENEIRVNIQRVAEGHLDLSRNLHEAMKPNNEIEMLAIKVRMLETEVRDLKQKIS